MRRFLSLIGVGILGGVVLGQVSAKPRMIKANGERYTYLGGKQSVLRLDFDAIRKRKWTAQSSNPPVSAREAIEKANAVRKQMAKNEDVLKAEGDRSWELESLSLNPLDPGNLGNEKNKDCWYWLVRYEAFGSIGGQPPQLEVAILMDGTVVRPVLREYK